MLHLHFSNRLDALADGLLAAMDAAPAAHPLALRTVVVPSAGVQRWLSRHIALRQGVCAGVEFPYLAAWLWKVTARVVPGVGRESPFSADVLAWRLHAALADTALMAPHPLLRNYLAQADEVMRHDLAQRIASVFESYLTYRPAWLAAWQRGQLLGLDTGGAPGDEAWQAALWRQLANGLELAVEHPVQAMVQTLKQALVRGSSPLAGADREAALSRAGLGAAVHLFALPSMPPLYLQALQGLAECVDVHVHALNPCAEYWFEVVDRRRLAWLQARGTAQGHEVGNRLLAAWGGSAQSNLESLVAASGDGVLDDARFVTPEGTGLLQAWQRSVLALEELGPVALAADDCSVEVRVCHSLMRQVEVLHDALLALFSAPDAPHPSQVLVVTPDLEALAPLVEAVFGSAPPTRRLEFTLTGRARSTENPAARALLALMALADSRATAASVFALLQLEPVARRFGLDAPLLDRLHDALRASGVRWGLDAAHREASGTSPDGRHTFDDALQRLFLAHTLPEGLDEPFAGLWPAHLAGSRLEAAALGALWAAVQGLREWRQDTAGGLPAAAWAPRLHRLIEDFIDLPPSAADDLAEVHQAIASVTRAWQAAGLAREGAAPLGLALVRQALTQALDAPARGGVPAGGITVAAMSSLRSLPCEVLCVVGLDGQVFPGTQRPAEFDLMARHPQRGDRQRRADDRQLFLDLLLAARRRVLITCTGRSVRDNAPVPLSGVVEEWLDVLVPAIAEDGASPASLAAARARLVVEHPLQPFSARAFSPDSDPRVRSHDEETARAMREGWAAQAQAEAAAALDAQRGRVVEGHAIKRDLPEESEVGAAGKVEEAEETAGVEEDEGDEGGDSLQGETDPPFFGRPLPPPGPGERTLTLTSLESFYRLPAAYLLKRRLGLALDWGEEQLEEDDPFHLEWGPKRALVQRLMPLLLRGEPRQRIEAAAQAGVELPTGSLGSLELQALIPALQGLASRWRAEQSGAVLPQQEHRWSFCLRAEHRDEAETWQLHATWNELRPAGLLRRVDGKLQPRDQLQAWVQHVALCASGLLEHPSTVLVGLDQTVRFRPVEDARTRLQELVQGMRQGLCEPLRLFPKSSAACAEAGDAVHGLGKAHPVWVGRQGHPGEGERPEHRLAWRGRTDALGGDFVDLAQRVFGPLIAHRSARFEAPAADVPEASA